MEKPSLPKGTRDFGPAQMAKRQFIFDNIKKVFQTYGFQPLETPAMENLSTLTGKYGEEGDQLLFRVSDSGSLPDNLQNKLMFALKRWLRNVCDFIFNKLTENETRDLNAVRNLLDSNEDFVYFGLMLKEEEKIVLKAFVQDHYQFIINDLIAFFNKANLHKENYKSQIEFRFIQFEINSIIPNHGDRLVETIWNYKLRNLSYSDLSEKGLRYDLTVPFARYVVMNKGEITFPFKRYQIQPVWRADRPQKGRYREFYQCDADVVGTDSLICEAEIILMIKDVFKRLGIQDYSIKVNHRGILSGLAALANATENESSLFVAIDKLDKIGEEKVREELASRGFDQNSLNTVFEILNFSGSTQEKIDFLKEQFTNSAVGQKGISDFKEVLNLLANYGSTEDNVEFDISLARGLSYYTGCIFEVKISNVAIGSVSGGGRYDNLTSMFDDKEKLSGVGFSFGVDRLYDAMTELEAKEKRSLFPEGALISSRVLICHTNQANMLKGLTVLNKLRVAGIASEIYPDDAKAKKPLEKPFQYATKKAIPHAIVVDTEDELLIFKNVRTGAQEKLPLETIIEQLKYQS